MQRMREAGLGHIPMIAGGIFPEQDAISLLKLGVSQVYTPMDFQINRIMSDFIALAWERSSGLNL